MRCKTADMTESNQGDSAHKKNYHHGDLHSALVASAMEILTEDGIEALSLRAVARKAGVSQAAPYHHFRSKEHLLEAVAIEGYRLFRQSLLEHVRNDTERPFRGMGVGYVMFAVEQPALFRMMQSSFFVGKDTSQEYADSAAASLGVLTEFMADAHPGTSADDRLIKSAAAWSMVHGLAMLILDGQLDKLTGGTIDPEEMARRVTEQLAL